MITPLNNKQKPIQAGDYGKPDQRPEKPDRKKKIRETDGRKMLALWGTS